MNKDIVFIGQVRSGTESFLDALNEAIPNSLRIRFEKFTGEEYKKKREEDKTNILKIYNEVLWHLWEGPIEELNEEIFNSFLDDTKFDIIFMVRRSYEKIYLTKILQDNLIGVYGRDYREFRINKDVMIETVDKFDDRIGMTERLLERNRLRYCKVFFEDFLPENIESNPNEKIEKFLGLKLNKDIVTREQYNDEVAKKFILNYDEIKDMI